MADFAPLKTGRLVVRYHSPWRGRWFVVGCVLAGLVVLYLVFEWGRFEGGYSKLAEMQQRRELTAQIESLREENEKLRAEIAAAELAREVDRKAYADVEKNLAELQAQVLRHREELTFYRGIVAPEDGVGRLRIQSFNVLPGAVDRQYRMRLVLVQSMRQDTVVSGTVTVQIEGVQENRPVVLSLGEVGGKTRADGQVPIQFRYFQNLEQDIELPEGFEPRAVNVEVRSGRLDPVRESYPWQVQAEG
jgi:HSP20 family molecular chaperone IbpA